MKTRFLTFIGAFAALFVGALAVFGMTPVGLDGSLAVCVDWIEGFTAHIDGIALATAGAPALTTEIKNQLEELKKNVISRITPLEDEIKTINEQYGGGGADLKEQVQKISQDNAKLIDESTEAIKKMVQDRQDAFEAKMKERGFQGGDGAAVDVTAPFIKALPQKEGQGVGFHGGDPILGFNEKVKADIDAKAYLAKTVTSLAASAGDAQIPVYEPTIVAPGEQPITLLDILPRSTTTSPLIYWVVEVLSSRTNNAGIQSLDFTGTNQGVALGESDFVFDQKSAETRTFGHTAKIALQILEDVGQLRGYLENVMRYMVRFDLEDQIINGAGTGTNISGLKTQATAYDVSIDAGVANLQKLDVLRMAILQCALTFFPATASLLHPSDAAGIELLKDGDQRYLFVSNPNAGQVIRPWGVPVVSTTQQTEDDFTVGAFNLTEVVIRKAIEVLVSTENEDDFDKLLATMRAYGRFGLKVYQPGSIIDGDFSLALTGTA